MWQHEMRELMRGFAGALFVALPLLYTQEMWERALNIDPWTMIGVLVVAYAANAGYHAYTGFKVARSRTSLVWDPITSFGLGALASLVTLYLTVRVGPETSLPDLAAQVALMSVPTSFGASLAINQLGQRSYNDREKQSIAEACLSEDWQKITATVLGGFLFAFNIAPTIEPRLLIVDMTGWHALFIAIFSVLVSYGVEFLCRFEDEEHNQSQGVLGAPWLTTLVTYQVSLATGAVLLWMFGYIGPSTPPEMWIPYIVVVGYAATLGGTAGRTIL